jgi:FkbM family methyltransferase
VPLLAIEIRVKAGCANQWFPGRKIAFAFIHMPQESIFALTSLAPTPWRVSQQRTSIRSWRDAGLRVYSLNHPSEIVTLSSLYDVDWVPIRRTSAEIFGRPCVPIRTMVEWAAENEAIVLLINSDIELRLSVWEMKRIRWLSDGGLCYFVRFNHNGNPGRASREHSGIDAFLLHGRDAALVPDSLLSMGQPFWDYLLPHVFADHNRPVYSVEFPVALHRDHRLQWSWENWHRCGLEFKRVTKAVSSDSSFGACGSMSVAVRASFESSKVCLSAHPMKIRDWVQQTFRYPGPKTFLEIGSHLGTDTAWMAELCDVTIHAFEPDPRNQQPPRHNVVQHSEAIADHDGRAAFTLSREGWGQEWTYSSSIKKPKNHLHRFPVTFGDIIEVETVTLDTFSGREDLGVIDFVWADVQGAEGEMIRGGRDAFARTRYLYTAYSDDELYEGQITLRDIVDLLGEFRVLEVWPDEVLLENSKMPA